MTTITLTCGDCLEVLPTLATSSIDCVIADPPYPEIDRAYGRMTESDWHAMMRQVIAETRRVLKPRGSAVFILQPNSERIGRMRPWLWEFMAWTCREWNMVQDAWWWNVATLPQACTVTGKLLRPSLKACVWLGPIDCYRNQDAVLWTESKAQTSDRLALRGRMTGRVRHPSGHSINRAKVAETSAERGGVTPFNVLPFANTNSTSSAGAFGHGAGTPLALCHWWTRYIAPPGGTVLDPFAGTGTTGIAAVMHGCSYVGIERDEGYFCSMQQRVHAAAAQQNLFNESETTRP